MVSGSLDSRNDDAPQPICLQVAICLASQLHTTGSHSVDCLPMRQAILKTVVSAHRF
jgi:hypothetical protein